MSPSISSHSRNLHSSQGGYYRAICSHSLALWIYLFINIFGRWSLTLQHLQGVRLSSGCVDMPLRKAWGLIPCDTVTSLWSRHCLFAVSHSKEFSELMRFPVRLKEERRLSILAEFPPGILGSIKMSYDSYLLLFSIVKKHQTNKTQI